MLTAIIRNCSDSDHDGVCLSMHNVDGMPLYSSVSGRYANVDEAKCSINHLGLNWQAPDAHADESVILVGKQ